ncbi:hypothetical protein E4U41_003940 [Claviceps citrina]|nr:hypothetical protein E4U41_003940 [Claviceps citrina]
MAYILFSISVLFIVVATVLFLTRSCWRPYFPEIRLPGADYIYSRLPDSFSGDVEAGLSSSTFDLTGNLEGDSRAGLDDVGKQEVLRIMKSKRMTFDQARKAYIDNRFKAHGIGPDGRPRDPKFVSFS